MTVIRMTVSPEPDGSLHLTVPVGVNNGTFEVAIVVTPKPESAGVPGWPDGYFERTYGSITDESFAPPSRLPPELLEPIG
jgi:hypothetical protein